MGAGAVHTTIEDFAKWVNNYDAGAVGGVLALWGIGQEPHDADYMAVGDLSTLHLCPHQPGYARIA